MAGWVLRGGRGCASPRSPVSGGLRAVLVPPDLPPSFCGTLPACARVRMPASTKGAGHDELKARRSAA